MISKLSYVMAQATFSTLHNNAEGFKNYENKAQVLLSGITEIEGENGLEIKCDWDFCLNKL